MKIPALLKTLFVSCLLSAFFGSTFALAQGLYIEGYEPDSRRPEQRVQKVYLYIENGLIQKKSQVPFEVSEATQKILEADTGPLLLSAGFIDLHGHLKYNVIPLWSEAQGQFINRFQWRAKGSYKAQVTAPLNNEALGSSSDPSSLLCQIYQYAEIKSLLGGTTSVQGIGNDLGCTKGLLARNVENEADYNETTDIRVSTEVINPNQAQFLQDSLFPAMLQSKKTFDEVSQEMMLATEHAKAAALAASATFTTNATSGTSSSTVQNIQFIDTIKAPQVLSSSQKFFLDGRNSYMSYLAKIFPEGAIRSFIIHLAEGRRNDAYNKLEYKLAQSMGYAQKGLVIIHGVGLDEKDLEHAQKMEMSLVWSPLSNLLLYGESLNVNQALEKGLNITLGADWSPSGSKNLLEEVKIAREYARQSKMNLVTDRKLYEMLTINPAKALKLEHKVGQLKQGYLADLVAFPLKSKKVNPYTQIITATASDVKLVLVGGKIHVAHQKIMNTALKTESEPVISEAQLQQFPKSCAQYSETMITNTPLKLSTLLAQLKNTFPQLDELTSCSDQKYQTIISSLFTPQWKESAPAPVIDKKSYEPLAEQLDQILHNH